MTNTTFPAIFVNFPSISARQMWHWPI